jgi:hypothetical protein
MRITTFLSMLVYSLVITSLPKEAYTKNIPEVNAGIIASFNQKFINDYKNTFNLEFL